MRLPDGKDAISRRRFLTLLSASASLAVGTSCSRIDRGTIVPFTKRPGGIIPGVANYYASTFQEGLATHGVLVKAREGRPIHIAGNSEHAVSRGSASLRAMGDLLGLYDPDRLRGPLYKGEPATWEDARKTLAKALSDARLMERRVLFLTNALVSPTQKALLYDLRLALPGLRHAAFEPAAPQPEIAESTALFGKAIIPRVHLDRAGVVLSLQSDFLGTDPNAPVFTRDFSRRRAVSGRGSGMNRLWVLEGSMTLTGANADQRLQARPSALAGVAFALALLLNQKHALPLPEGLTPEDFKPFEIRRAAQAAGIDPAALRLLADNLAHAGKSALVLAGPALTPQAHAACYLLNSMLGAVGNTLDLAGAPPPPELTGFSELQSLLQKAEQGEFAIGIFWSTNPAYAFPDHSLWKKAVAKIPETYRIGLYEDETALDCAWRLPEHHWLESWGDFEPSSDYVSLRQPVSGPIHDTMQAEEFLLECLRRMKVRTRPSYCDYLKSRWQSDVFPAGSPVPFESFWNAALHDGGARREPRQQPPFVMNAAALKDAIATSSPATAGGLELVLSPGSGVYDGRYANNGWLNELPDPVTKSDWGNPVLLSLSDAERLGVQQEDVVSISIGSMTVETPVIIQPGQSPGVAALALGYGRRTGSVAVGIGVNAYPLINILSKSPYLLTGVKIIRSGERREIPKTQMHDRMEGRQLARSLTLAEYSHEPEHHGEKHAKHEPHHTASLIPELKFPQNKWGMAIDLSLCTGCSACVIACQSENNVPVVGPERILDGRHMQWIRIDRYYEGDLRSPSVLHQPMLCQHCDNAPCEIVCPVNATTHSPDGLNQMAYNRCVGTRYCSNNCPFKVRRFNFFDYTSTKREPEILVYNPEVTVRPRGVMEKCTFCVQRIQDVRQLAKFESRQVRDGEIQPACAAACPAGAIVFGDLNDPESRVSKMVKMDRHYRLLEELGIKPSVTYLTDIANPAITKDRA
ncbi:MAG: molybdopterin oxidoreductase, iron-sulfur binding subunit [Acidobacteria bacterium]|nr:molybdopterin oxidoreductase, iron-sulfur binding subunit [Acidobacteriota bacterium]